MDRSNGLAHFYVNNSSVSVSGTTSAASLPYQIAFAAPLQAQTHGHFLDQTGCDNCPRCNYDAGLSDLIDPSYQYSYLQYHRGHHYSDNSPLSSISAPLGDEDDEDRVSRSTNHTYYGNSTNFNEIDRSNCDSIAFRMAPTAIVAADSSTRLEFRNGRALYSHGNTNDDGSSSKSNGGKLRKFKNPQLAVQQRRQANMRERRRMKSINHAFDGLRVRLPTLPYEKKLSKVDTLKLAIGYIQFLQGLIETVDREKGKNDTVQGENGDDEGRTSAQGREQRNHRNHALTAQLAKKIIIECRKDSYEPSDCDSTGAPPLRGHSLSWSRVGEPNSQNLMTAKVWRPQEHKEEPQ